LFGSLLITAWCYIYIYILLLLYKNFLLTSFSVAFNELNLVGLALDMVD